MHCIPYKCIYPYIYIYIFIKEIDRKNQGNKRIAKL